MASGSATNAEAATASPSITQLLFARAVINTFDLWPALRLAITEQWGGIESKAKADFLISYICDEYSKESIALSSSFANQGSTVSSNPPDTPDIDDLAEILEGYFADEYESRLEDESADWIAGRIVQLHKIIYAIFPPTEESISKANEEVNKLEQASIALRGKKVIAHTKESESEESLSGDEEDGGDHMEVDNLTAAKSTSRSDKTEPVVDEEGFTTVVKNKRR